MIFVLSRLASLTLAIAVVLLLGGKFHWWMVPVGIVAGSAWALVDPLRTRRGAQ
jgi:hypothetical protein